MGTTQLDRARAQAMDRADRLAPFRDRFVFADGDTIYLCGNSLGRQPRAAVERMATATQEWATRLVDGWDDWLDLPSRVGDALAGPLLGAGPGQVVVSDSTSVNLYKLAVAARSSLPGRPVLVTDAGNFPTDRYILDGLSSRRLIPTADQSTADRSVADRSVADRSLADGASVDAIGVDDVVAALDDQVALVCLSHIDYRSSAVADMVAITAAVHDAGALMLWDLSHSVGCYPIELDAAGVDLAVGCTYKYLGAGPGAPAFLYVRQELQGRLRQPIWGWFGQRDQFAMGAEYEPYRDVRQFLVGTPPVIGLAGVRGGVDVVAEAGVMAIRAKARALGQLAVDLHHGWLAANGFVLGSPEDPAVRGSHVALRHPDAARLHGELGRRGRVVTDFRFPNTIRMGLAPLTTRFVDVWDAFDRLRELSY